MIRHILALRDVLELRAERAVRLLRVEKLRFLIGGWLYM
jgi:hypothetical protein